MKKVAFLILLAATVLTSCQKEVIAPADPVILQDITVEYRVHSESGNVQVEMLIPKQGSSALETQALNVNRADYSYQFTTKSNVFLSLKSWNTNPSWKEITVEIFVNGNLFQSATLDHTTATASASGTFVE